MGPYVTLLAITGSPECPITAADPTGHVITKSAT